ncbi:hypothetical protein NliqN6_1670 [Naganishia liquefaciens]|uniref:PCI domain-containing protein n=1 Tax=Naganishia liquefaciens TaxID=104408 RepID=A0A8H3YDJ1_9TREE|nr:hypothetical protein NliqN6_1670 [Naganishia liquefaciens]
MTSPLARADALVSTDPAQAETLYKQILSEKAADDEGLREQETALLRLGAIYKASGNAEALAELVTQSRSFMSNIAKAKTAKLIRTLIDSFPPEAREKQITVVKDNIEWARNESRVFLRQSLEVKLIGLQVENQQYRPALALIETLLRELKRLDDKMILTEVHLLESRVNHATKNYSKAKAALTSAKTSAAAIYCPPLLQAQLDMQSGVLHTEDKDYKTGYSYFFETFEGFSGQDDDRALPALKNMCLCKIMMNLPDDVAPILGLKAAAKYLSRETEAMQAVAKALKERSLEQFEKTLQEYSKELHTDLLIRTHLALLYDTLLEQNLVRVIEPYSVVELAYIAKEVGQPLNSVESKLSQMILDGVFQGVLDQEKGRLIVYDEPEKDSTYATGLETIKQISEVVNGLSEKARRLT